MEYNPSFAENIISDPAFEIEWKNSMEKLDAAIQNHLKVRMVALPDQTSIQNPQWLAISKNSKVMEKKAKEFIKAIHQQSFQKAMDMLKQNPGLKMAFSKITAKAPYISALCQSFVSGAPTAFITEMLSGTPQEFRWHECPVHLIYRRQKSLVSNPLHFACYFKRDDIVPLLLEDMPLKYKMKGQENDGESPIFLTVTLQRKSDAFQAIGIVPLLSYLVPNDVVRKSVDLDGQTPLIRACKNQVAEELITCLLETASIESKSAIDKSGRTALHYLLEAKKPKENIIQEISRSVSCETRTHIVDNSSPLMLAIQKDCAGDTIELLLQDTEPSYRMLKNGDGKTVLDMALSQSPCKPAIIKQLVLGMPSEFIEGVLIHEDFMNYPFIKNEKLAARVVAALLNDIDIDFKNRQLEKWDMYTPVMVGLQWNHSAKFTKQLLKDANFAITNNNDESLYEIIARKVTHGKLVSEWMTSAPDDLFHKIRKDGSTLLMDILEHSTEYPPMFLVREILKCPLSIRAHKSEKTGMTALLLAGMSPQSAPMLKTLLPGLTHEDLCHKHPLTNNTALEMSLKIFSQTSFLPIYWVALMCQGYPLSSMLTREALGHDLIQRVVTVLTKAFLPMFLLQPLWISSQIHSLSPIFKKVLAPSTIRSVIQWLPVFSLGCKEFAEHELTLSNTDDDNVDNDIEFDFQDDTSEDEELVISNVSNENDKNGDNDNDEDDDDDDDDEDDINSDYGVDDGVSIDNCSWFDDTENLFGISSLPNSLFYCQAVEVVNEAISEETGRFIMNQS